MATTPEMDAAALGGKMVEAVRGYVARALQPVNSRVSATETRIGALSLLLGKNAPPSALTDVEALIARSKTQEAHIAALTARIDRLQQQQSAMAKEINALTRKLA
jgi:hypothetical protein